MKIFRLMIVALALGALGAGCRKSPQEVERPERIHSKRLVLYDSATYAKLAGLWEKYYDAYPSEDAYANWMYAAFYAQAVGAETMIDKGVEKYPANPVLLYLSARTKDWGPRSSEGSQLLIKATALDPEYMDPWHSLAVHYIVQGDRENADVALRHLLSGGAIDDMIMDFSYNMISSLDTNSVLITNGDNDTFPGWVLTRIIRYRPDVKIVNRALLNLDEYVLTIVKEGIPPFISKEGLDSLKSHHPADAATPPGDRLLLRLVEACGRAGIPAYCACTIDNYGFWKSLPQARALGLVTLVTPASIPRDVQVRKLLTTWMTVYRAEGLDGWQLHAAGPASAARALVPNYAAALRALMPEIEAAGPDVQLSLFRWYRLHIMDLLDRNFVDKANTMWFGPNRPREIMEWARSKGRPGD